MKIEFTYLSKVENGVLISNRKPMSEAIKSFEGKIVEIRIRQNRSKRSTLQNNYYWLILSIFAKEIGYSVEELHEACKFKFLSNMVVLGNKEEVFAHSTTKLSKSEFSDYVECIKQWAAELNIYLPDAGEQTEINL